MAGEGGSLGDLCAPLRSKMKCFTFFQKKCLFPVRLSEVGVCPAMDGILDVMTCGCSGAPHHPGCLPPSGWSLAPLEQCQAHRMWLLPKLARSEEEGMVEPQAVPVTARKWDRRAAPSPAPAARG